MRTNTVSHTRQHWKLSAHPPPTERSSTTHISLITSIRCVYVLTISVILGNLLDLSMAQAHAQSGHCHADLTIDQNRRAPLKYPTWQQQPQLPIVMVPEYAASPMNMQEPPAGGRKGRPTRLSPTTTEAMPKMHRTQVGLTKLRSITARDWSSLVLTTSTVLKAWVEAAHHRHRPEPQLERRFINYETRGEQQRSNFRHDSCETTQGVQQAQLLNRNPFFLKKMDRFNKCALKRN